jgi:hypothetical protein
LVAIATIFRHCIISSEVLQLLESFSAQQTIKMNTNSLPAAPAMLRENKEHFYNSTATTSTSSSTSTSTSSIDNTLQIGTKSSISPSPTRSTSKPTVAATSRYNYKKALLDLNTKKKGTSSIDATSNYSNSNTNNITDTENCLLEPISIWERACADSRTNAMKKARTAETHPVSGRLSSSSNMHTSTQTDHDREALLDVDIETKTTASSGTLSYHSPQEVIDFLMQRQRRLLMNQKADTTADTMGHVTQGTPAVLSSLRPTINEVNRHIDSDYFLDGKELERNVVIDYPTDRSYIYTTDLQTKWMLPEFLFLDVPNSTYAARACGQFITNKLVAELNQMVKPGSKTSAVLEGLVKNINKSDYEVQNIYVPRRQPQYQHGHRQTSTHHRTHRDSTHNVQHDVPIQAITAKFRLRFARSGTNIHKMLSQNFMNDRNCARGILVFIPSMEKGSPADHFWGSLENVDGLPEVDESINNSKMDRWCSQVAKQHGTYRGKDPELMSLAVSDRQQHCIGPYSYHETNVAMKRTATTKKATREVLGTSTKKVAAAKKKTNPKKKMIKSALAKTKRDPHKIPP